MRSRAAQSRRDVVGEHGCSLSTNPPLAWRRAGTTRSNGKAHTDLEFEHILVSCALPTRNTKPVTPSINQSKGPPSLSGAPANSPSHGASMQAACAVRIRWAPHYQRHRQQRPCRHRAAIAEVCFPKRSAQRRGEGLSGSAVSACQPHGCKCCAVWGWSVIGVACWCCEFGRLPRGVRFVVGVGWWSGFGQPCCERELVCPPPLLILCELVRPAL